MVIRMLFALPCFLIPAITTQVESTSDEEAIRNVLRRNYVEGMYIKHDPDVLRAGLASTFVMQVYWDGELTTRTTSQWFERLKLNRIPTKNHVESDIKVLDITGVAAVARVDIYVNSKHKYTDYFGLYKTQEGWKMVTKMFHAHRSMA